jgi:large repetitive protein
MKRCLPLILSLFALAVPATAGATTFGAEVGGDFTNQVRGGWSQARVMSNLSSLYEAGGRVGRADSDWTATEPKAPVRGRHAYDWSYNDLIVSEMASARLRWEPTLAFAPRWAEVHRSNVLHLKSGRAIAYLPPAHNADFAAYATAFMKRYGPHGAFWKANPDVRYVPVTTVEVWNEPDNIHDWGTDINLSDYARMYEAVRSAVHRVYRGARVMTGGLAWTESSLPRLLKAFRGLPMDAIAIHPYGATPSQSITVARDALADMRGYGRGRTPVSANEYGWTSIRDTWGSTSPRHVKSYAYNALIGLAKLRLSEIVPFSWGDPSWGLSTGSFANAVAKITHHH